MDSDIKHNKRSNGQRPKVWQDIVIKKPTVTKVETPQKKEKKTKHFKLPKLTKIARPFKIKKIRVTKKSYVFVFAVVLLATFSAVFYFNQNRRIISGTNKGNKPYTVTKLETGTPDYSTVTPDNKKIVWTKISPPESDTAIYAYADKITDVPISVTEQPLPDDFKTETSYKIEKLAKSYDANTKLSADDISIYVGTSVRDSVQSVILVKNNLLIMIKSKNIISDQEWVNYVNSLE